MVPAICHSNYYLYKEGSIAESAYTLKSDGLVFEYLVPPFSSWGTTSTEQVESNGYIVELLSSLNKIGYVKCPVHRR